MPSMRKRLKLKEGPPKDLEQNSDRLTGCEGVPLAMCRSIALAKAKLLPTATSLVPPLAPAKSWIALGPQTIPGGEPSDLSLPRVMVTGRIAAIVVHPTKPSTIFLGAAMGGVWKTDDGGQSWMPTSDAASSLAIGALAMDPSNPNVLYAGTGEGNLDTSDDFVTGSSFGAGVLKTTDGGATWIQLAESIFTAISFFRIAINPANSDIVFAATSAGLFRSINAGNSWTKLNGALPLVAATDVAIDPATPSTVYAGFSDQSIFRSDDADQSGAPTWSARLLDPVPANPDRCSLSVSRSSPQTIYATRNAALYQSTDRGDTWLLKAQLSLTPYCSSISVHPTDPNLVFLSGPELYLYDANKPDLVWIGSSIHTDHHGVAFEQGTPATVYAATDGGLFKSLDGGQSWTDSINKNLPITQITFIDQHPNYEAVMFGGTQDNGTIQFRNSPTFYHSDDEDGGAVTFDHVEPDNVLHVRTLADVWLSNQGGDNWKRKNVKNSNPATYPPLTFSRSDAGLAAFGADKLFLDEQFNGTWDVTVAVPLDANETITAIDYVRPDLIYIASSCGKVFRIKKDTATNTWTPTAVHTAALPMRHVWDVSATLGDDDQIVLVMSGFGTSHVWKGAFQSGTPTTWTDISGTGAGALPDIPVNALCLDPDSANSMYIGSDIGVFCTTDGGTNWAYFSEGLPAAAVVTDMRLFASESPAHQRLLRVGTYGRGMWERDLEGASTSDVSLFLRANILTTGRAMPPPTDIASPFAEPMQSITFGGKVYWWNCADLKIDAPPFQTASPAEVDYTFFERSLKHCPLTPAVVNRIYLQVHNRGINAATQVIVKVLYTTAAGLGPLPQDFWANFPADSSDSTTWKSVGLAKTIAIVEPNRPHVESWDWMAPQGSLDQTCFLAIVDCAQDPIARIETNIQTLVNKERHAGLRSWKAPV